MAAMDDRGVALAPAEPPHQEALEEGLAALHEAPAEVVAAAFAGRWAEPIGPEPVEVARWDHETFRAYLLGQGWPALTVDAAVRIAYCESQFRSWAVGDNRHSFGLFQVQPRWHAWRVLGGPARPLEDSAEIERVGQLLLDPAINVAVALEISSGGTDWSAWSCKP